MVTPISKPAPSALVRRTFLDFFAERGHEIVPSAPLIPQNDARTALLGQGGSPIQDLLENGTDSPFSILAGEDRMSSTAMESFTQSPAAFPNCFSCHNTQAITARGVPLAKDGSGRKLLDPKLLNVSHVFSQFVLEETQ